MNEEQRIDQEQATTETPMEFEWTEDRFKELQAGQIISAKVILVRDDLVFVDIGGKSDLTISLEDLTAEPVSSAKQVVKPGDVIQVLVTRAGDEERWQLSKRLVDQEQTWVILEDAFKTGKELTAMVLGAVKGGLSVKVESIKGFMPASQVALGYVENLEAMTGHEFPVKVIEFDREKRRVVVSRRIILEAEKQKAEAEIYAQLKEGERKTGKVTRIADFGAFVDIGSGVEGLIHVSELSWNRVKTPREILTEGDRVEVLVTKVDPAARKISLSLRQIQNHPWDEAIKNFREEGIYPGTVVRMEPFGAFIRLAPGIDGLAHVSQISDKRIGKPDEVLKLGETVQAKILKVDRANRKVSLSLNAVTQDKENQELQEYFDTQTEGAFTQSLGDFFKKDK